MRQVAELAYFLVTSTRQASLIGDFTCDCKGEYLSRKPFYHLIADAFLDYEISPGDELTMSGTSYKGLNWVGSDHADLLHT